MGTRHTCGENQLAVLRHPEPIFAAVVGDDQFAARAQKLTAADAGGGDGADMARHLRKGKGIFDGGHKIMIMILICLSRTAAATRVVAKLRLQGVRAGGAERHAPETRGSDRLCDHTTEAGANIAPSVPLRI